MVGEVLGAVVMREVRGVPGEVTASAYDLCRGLCVGTVGQIRLAFWSSEVLEFRRHRDRVGVVSRSMAYSTVESPPVEGAGVACLLAALSLFLRL